MGKKVIRKKVRRVHKVHTGKPVNVGSMFGIPQAHAQSDTAGQFNPPDWNKSFDYGTSPQGQNLPPKSMMPSGSVHTPPTQTPPPLKRTQYSKTNRPVYATSREGNITKLDYNPSMQQRQQLHEAGFKLTTIKPHKVHQQGFTDDFGITTYIIDGSISTGPTSNQFERELEAASSDIDPEQPRSVYAEEEAGPPDKNSIVYGTLPPYPPHTRTGVTRIRGKKDRLAKGPFAAGDPNSLLRRVFGWGTRDEEKE